MRRPSPTARDLPAAAWLFWALAIVPAMFILPLYVYPLSEGGHIAFSGRRLMQVFWAGGVFFALFRPPVMEPAARTWSALPLSVRVAAGSFVAWAFLSAIVSSAPPYALREWSLVVLLLIIVIPLAVMLSERASLVMAVLGATLVVYAMVTLPAPLEHGFAHPRFLGQAMAVAGPVLLFSGNLWLALLAAPAMGLGILNGSRALLLTIVVVTLAAALLWPDRRRRMVPGLIGLGLAGLVVLVLVALGHDAELQAAVDRGTTLTGRDTMWRDAFGRFLGAPLLGIGPGLLARAPGVAGWAGQPHNSVFLIAAETGIVGLAAAGALVLAGVKRLTRIAADRRPWALGLVAGGFHSMFSGTILMPASQTLLVLALAMVLPVPPGDDPERPPRRDTFIALAVIGGFALVILLATLSLPPGGLSPRTIGPRFYSPGLIP